MTASVVDLCCGVGGLTHGFYREGFRVVAGIDVDDRCRYGYERNNEAQFIARDVARVSVAELRRLFPANTTRILAGCAPCTPFTLYRNGKPRTRNAKWRMLDEFGRLANGVRPEIVTMENVPQLATKKVFRDFVGLLEQSGYWVTWFVARSHEYGVPQRRTRLVLFASRLGAIELLSPTHPGDEAPTVWDAIGHLPPIAAGDADGRDRIHRARNLSDLNQRRIRATSEGGWWRDWDTELLLQCHKKQAGRSFRTVYGRMAWDRQAPTITTQCIGLGNGQFGHPEQDRAISVREAALLQTFPRCYRFVPPRGQVKMQTLALHIGNAVPVRLGRIVARSIKRHLASCGSF